MKRGKEIMKKIFIIALLCSVILMIGGLIKMDHEKVYVFCENMCKEEGMTAEQIFDVIGTESHQTHERYVELTADLTGEEGNWATSYIFDLEEYESEWMRQYGLKYDVSKMYVVGFKIGFEGDSFDYHDLTTSFYGNYHLGFNPTTFEQLGNKVWVAVNSRDTAFIADMDFTVSLLLYAKGWGSEE